MSTFFFFNDTATTEIYTLSLHDALPISTNATPASPAPAAASRARRFDRRLGELGGLASAGVRSSESIVPPRVAIAEGRRSEEHTSELQSRQYLVCRLLLEKKKHHSCHLT